MIVEGGLAVIIETTRTGPATTLVIDRLTPAQNPFPHLQSVPLLSSTHICFQPALIPWGRANFFLRQRSRLNPFSFQFPQDHPLLFFSLFLLCLREIREPSLFAE